MVANHYYFQAFWQHHLFHFHLIHQYRCRRTSVREISTKKRYTILCAWLTLLVQHLIHCHPTDHASGPLILVRNDQKSHGSLNPIRMAGALELPSSRAYRISVVNPPSPKHIECKNAVENKKNIHGSAWENYYTRALLHIVYTAYLRIRPKPVVTCYCQYYFIYLWILGQLIAEFRVDFCANSHSEFLIHVSTDIGLKWNFMCNVMCVYLLLNEISANNIIYLHSPQNE